MGILFSTHFFQIKNTFMNIIETIQKNLGFTVLQKIDPNTQETADQGTAIGNGALAQAGIPAILLGIYNRLESDPAFWVLEQEGDLLGKIFGKSKNVVVSKIAEYSKNNDQHSVQQLEHIASESLRVLKDSLGNKTDENSIRSFVSKNKPDILLYLPPSLELGKVFQNNNLDDRTGKMEGPVSSFMRNVEKAFNSSNSI
jgi:hypothetical protein